MTTNPKHGEPGHECVKVDIGDTIAGVLIRPFDRDDDITAFEVEAWANGIPKSVLAGFLRTVADSWDQDAHAETAEAN
jgi:hypothetical protein